MASNPSSISASETGGIRWMSGVILGALLVVFAGAGDRFDDVAETDEAAWFSVVRQTLHRVYVVTELERWPAELTARIVGRD